MDSEAVDFAPSLRQLLDGHRQEFETRFGPGATPRLFFSPGRVNLMGAHLDYNGGPVLPIAIDRGTFLAARPRNDRRVRLASTLGEVQLEANLDALPTERTGRWVDYPLGVLLDLAGRAVGEPGGIDILYGGNLPIGAGLSSSASVCVGTAFVLDRLWRLELLTLQVVDSALRAEREFVGVQCGMMDPYAVGLARPGHLLWLDCKDASWEHLPLDFESVCVAVADTGVRRELAQGEFNRRVDECGRAFEALRARAPAATCLRDVPRGVLDEPGVALTDVERRRARHVLDEVERTFAARTALQDGDMPAFGALMTAAHASLRDHYDVSCPELDVLVEGAVEAEGVLGARLTGAGFGGCVVILVARGAETAVREQVATTFERRFGRRPPIEFFGGDQGPREIL